MGFVVLAESDHHNYLFILTHLDNFSFNSLLSNTDHVQHIITLAT